MNWKSNSPWLCHHSSRLRQNFLHSSGISHLWRYSCVLESCKAPVAFSNQKFYMNYPHCRWSCDIHSVKSQQHKYFPNVLRGTWHNVQFWDPIHVRTRPIRLLVRHFHRSEMRSHEPPLSVLPDAKPPVSAPNPTDATKNRSKPCQGIDQMDEMPILILDSVCEILFHQSTLHCCDSKASRCRHLSRMRSQLRFGSLPVHCVWTHIQQHDADVHAVSEQVHSRAQTRPWRVHSNCWWRAASNLCWNCSTKLADYRQLVSTAVLNLEFSFATRQCDWLLWLMEFPGSLSPLEASP